MSWQASRAARDLKTGSPAAKSVLMILAEQADADGAACSIAVETIANRTELSRRAVIEHLGTLETAGFIRRERRVNAFGHRLPDDITLTLPGLVLGAPSAPRDNAKVQEAHLGTAKPRCTSRTAKVHLTDVLGAPPAPHIDKGLEEGLEEGTPKPSKAKTRATAIPNGFPNDDAVAWAANHFRSLGWDIDARREADKFRNRNLSKDGRYVDWMAAFRTWIMNAITFAEKDGRRPTAPRTATPEASIADPWRARVAAFADPTNRFWNPTDYGPAPGKPGCEAPAAFLAEFGFGSGNVVPMSKRGAA